MNISKIAYVATDDTPSETGKEAGFVTFFTRHISRFIVTFNCIDHQETVCAKTSSRASNRNCYLNRLIQCMVVCTRTTVFSGLVVGVCDIFVECLDEDGKQQYPQIDDTQRLTDCVRTSAS
jgi:hypothetical protein